MSIKDQVELHTLRERVSSLEAQVQELLEAYTTAPVESVGEQKQNGKRGPGRPRKDS